MEVNVHGDKVKITEAIQNYVESKIGRLDKYFDDPDNLKATVAIRVKGIDQTVEVTIPAKKFILRGEETNKDLYAAIDLVYDKIERQIRKNKTKMSKKAKDTYGMILDFDVLEPTEDRKIVKRKMVDMKPMSEEEAILQMEMLGHEFFIYKDAESLDACVLYRRKDGNYGIIETK